MTQRSTYDVRAKSDVCKLTALGRRESPAVLDGRPLKQGSESQPGQNFAVEKLMSSWDQR